MPPENTDNTPPQAPIQPQQQAGINPQQAPPPQFPFVNVPQTDVTAGNTPKTSDGEKKSHRFLSKLKWVVISIILIVIVGVVLFVTFPQIGVVIFNKYYFSESKTPQAYIVVKNRTISPTNLNSQNGTEFSDFGIKLTLPWNNFLKKDEPKDEDGVTAYSWKFAEDKTFAILRPLGINYSVEMLGNDPAKAEKLKDFFGGKTLDSNYDFFNTIYSRNPKEISLFKPKKEIIAKSTLLILKNSTIGAHKWEGGVYNFETQNIKGFQFGLPGKTDRIDIQFFDKYDKEYTILFKGVTQEEIDFVISTISFYN